MGRLTSPVNAPASASVYASCAPIVTSSGAADATSARKQLGGNTTTSRPAGGARRPDASSDAAEAEPGFIFQLPETMGGRGDVYACAHATSAATSAGAREACKIRVAVRGVASTRLRGVSPFRPSSSPRLVSAAYPRRGRGRAATLPRKCPRRAHGGAATRLRGMSASQPRRRRDPSLP